MNGLDVKAVGRGTFTVSQEAARQIRSWYEFGRIDRPTYRLAEEIGVKCAEELGDELPDNAISRGEMASWLRSFLERRVQLLN